MHESGDPTQSAKEIKDWAKKPRFSNEAIADLFTYHPPSADQIPKYETLRNGALEFAKIVVENTPESPDQTVAIRKLRECVMIANAAIALKGKF